MRDYFSLVFHRVQILKGWLFLQDGDPRLNLKVNDKAMESVGYQLFEILPRSSPIYTNENIFHLIWLQLTENALEYNIDKKTYEQFSNQVKNAIENVPVSAINKTISSMNKRLWMIVKGKGHPIKYWSIQSN